MNRHTIEELKCLSKYLSMRTNVFTVITQKNTLYGMDWNNLFLFFFFFISTILLCCVLSYTQVIIQINTFDFIGMTKKNGAP